MDKTRKPYPRKGRERIQAGMVLDRLHKHVKGEIDLTATQVNAARILLNKALPDLKAIEHTGDSGSKSPRKMSNDELYAEIERRRAGISGTVAGTASPESGETEPGSVH